MRIEELVTKEDLKKFREELLSEIQQVLLKHVRPDERRWLKTYEVRKMLGNISNGTMQAMRNKGILPYSIVNGLALYEYRDVVRVVEERKV